MKERFESQRTKGGHRRYSKNDLIKLKRNKTGEKISVGYCRVSSSSQKDDLDRQVENVSNLLYRQRLST